MPPFASWVLSAIVGLAALRPAPPPAGPTVVAVAGETHRLILLSDGTVVGWGNLGEGRLGPGAVPVPGSPFRSSRVTIPLPGRAIGIAANEATSYALLDDGSVWAFGRGWNGQLGVGTGTRESASPVRVKNLGRTVQIVATGLTALALQEDGTVRAWGSRAKGLIGDGKVPRTYGDAAPDAPLPVPVPGATGITRLAAGADHILALTTDGRVLAWGSNFGGALGRAPRQEIPIDSVGAVPGLADVVAIAAGSAVSSAVRKDGTVWVWGSNWHGQFGNGQRTDPPNMTRNWELVPQPVPGVSGAVAIAIGITGRHTLVLLRDGTLRGWGNTDWGQLGGGLAATFQPRVMTPRVSGIREIFAAGNNSYAVGADGSFWAWGAGRQDDLLLAHTKVPMKVAVQ
ncbi:MAG: hypothetical protein IT352_13550 [Gemmatimonadales bacterium]|nr:hypothetical protein [Gemmatimonadales bacterium]